MSTFFEAAPAGASKAEALHRVLARLRVEPHACLGVGDGDNDVTWLSLVGEPVAVANARPAVKRVATTHIGHHDEDAVAAFLVERLGLEHVAGS